MSLARAGDTRWGSHLKTIDRLLNLWKPVREVIIALSRDCTDRKTQGIALGLAEKMENFEFVFVGHLMLNLLRKTNDLSQALQLKNQNIGNAVRLIEDVKHDIKKYRDEGWEELMKEVTSFCSQNEIHVPNMEEVIPSRVRRTVNDEPQTYLHHFHVVDLLLNEMNERFTKSNTELLTCIACLDPRDSFQCFDREKLLRLAALYSEDFCGSDLGQLRIQLDRYISNVKSNEAFSGLRDIGELAKKMVEMKYHITYELVYRLVELDLVLPVATATVERSFSTIKYIKNNLRNKMDDNFLTDSLLCYVEKDVFANVENEAVLQRFQAMGPVDYNYQLLHRLGKKSDSCGCRCLFSLVNGFNAKVNAIHERRKQRKRDIELANMNSKICEVDEEDLDMEASVSYHRERYRKRRKSWSGDHKRRSLRARTHRVHVGVDDSVHSMKRKHIKHDDVRVISRAL
ncbi:uncharacterized protein LOC143557965 [Bidens hawaiensis]|uniref:uncharacterized protein LOC143557965 n=1 Tax=Bidens hawaiensis TaxID=980011 RepID=UPI00404B5A41